jgi:hypothetical protein
VAQAASAAGIGVRRRDAGVPGATATRQLAGGVSDRSMATKAAKRCHIPSSCGGDQAPDDGDTGARQRSDLVREASGVQTASEEALPSDRGRGGAKPW